MHKYVFNARDIAAYFKWFSVPQYLEVSYMQHIFNIGSPVLATPLTKNFEKFKKEVYRELYYLWANGFEDERSDISFMTSEDTMALICDQECINLESYMKLITLHLIFTKNLPYVNINFTGLPLHLGIRSEFAVYEENVVKAVEGLNLVATDKFGKPFDLNLGVPDELLSISLNSDFKKELFDKHDFRETLKTEQKEHMTELREKSLKVFGGNQLNKHKATRTKSSESKTKRISHGEIANEKRTSSSQPKGMPLVEKRHNGGKCDV